MRAGHENFEIKETKYNQVKAGWIITSGSVKLLDVYCNLTFHTKWTTTFTFKSTVKNLISLHNKWMPDIGDPQQGGWSRSLEVPSSPYTSVILWML